MKKLLLSIFICTMCCTVNAQTYASNKTATYSASYANLNYDTNTRDNNKNSFQYLVGTEVMPGYEVRVCTYSDSNAAVYKPKVFSNGKSAPILQMYTENKSKYIGSIMQDSTGKQTTIKDITLVEKGSTLVFTVTGKTFSMSFDLSSGMLLKESATETTFYTKGKGPWKIFAKK